jgi:hypothetical protein
MSICRLFIIVTYGLFLAVVSGGAIPPGSPPVSVRQEPPPNITAQNSITTTEAVVQVLIAAYTPGGLVRRKGCAGEDSKRQSEQVKQPLPVALDTIVMADPQYRWFMDRGVINLVPIMGEPDLLQVPIKEFKTAHTTNIHLALEQLLTLPEVRRKAINLHLKEGIKLFVGPSSPATKRT